MPIDRYFKLYLNAGRSIPLVINANQYDSSETWYFTLYTDRGEVYLPSSGAIIGIKADGHIIDNAATVDSRGRVVVTETEQMTAAAGKAVFEISIDDNSHGSANFIVLVKPKPSDGGVLSDSDLSLIQEAIDSTSPAAIAEGVSDWMDEHLTPTTPVVDDTLTVQGAAADAKKTGDEIADLKSALGDIEEQSGLTDDVKQALLALFRNVAYTSNRGQALYDDLYNALYAITAISLSSNSLTLNSIGATSQLTATTTPEGGAVTWSSSNDAVATVDETGLVTSVSYGSATITASAGSVSASCSVVVATTTVTSISAVYTQSGTVYDSDSLDSLKSDLVVTASWSDSTTSTVSANDYILTGTLTEGTSTITVSYGGATTTFNVTVSSLGTLIYNFDFSRSLIDTVQGYEATFVNPTYVEQVTGGYKITGASGGGNSGAIKLPVIGNNAVVVIEFGEVTKNSTTFTSGHGRLLMYSTSDTGIQNGLIYRNSQYWSWYTTAWQSDTSYTNWSDLSNSTLMMTVDGNNLHTVTVNGVQFAPSVTVNYSTRNFYIGSNTSSFRDVTVKSVKIYRTGE